MVLPHHGAIEKVNEESASSPIGTTLRGIGPAYQDKFARTGLRMGDLVKEGFVENQLHDFLEERRKVLGGTEEGVLEAIKICTRLRDRLRNQIVETRDLLIRMHDSSG